MIRCAPSRDGVEAVLTGSCPAKLSEKRMHFVREKRDKPPGRGEGPGCGLVSGMGVPVLVYLEAPAKSFVLRRCSNFYFSRPHKLFRYSPARAFSLLLCTGECGEVRLFLRKSRVGIGCSVCTRSENALAARLSARDMPRRKRGRAGPQGAGRWYFPSCQDCSIKRTH